MNIKKLFITIQFDSNWAGGETLLLDYPKSLLVPRTGEFVIFDGHSGRVSEVRHIIEGSVAEIKIVTHQTQD
jgi:hypothetical protein